MTILAPLTPVIDRGIALHKIIRCLTLTLGGEGYLNFMGNEFGHPEWIDFPREGNGESFHHCRRQWHLSSDALLRYPHLNSWDRSLQSLASWAGILLAKDEYVSLKHDSDKVIIAEKGGLVFAFNLHSTSSFSDYRIGLPRCEKYMAVLSSDAPVFGGHDRVAVPGEYFGSDTPHHGRPSSMCIYVPSRTCVVYAPESLFAERGNPPVVPEFAKT
jgi:1,4-alpha-glucan branching enzyme